MKRHPKLEERRKRISEDVKASVDKSFAIARQIDMILGRQGLTQKDLADRLNKSESEISKWMSGVHNFTMNTITNIELALREPVIMCPFQIPLNYTSVLIGALAQSAININPPNEDTKISWEPKGVTYKTNLSVLNN